MNFKGLENKKVLITGAAAGIGRACAKKFYDEGACICLVDIPTLEESELAHHFQERMTYIQADITSTEGINAIRKWMDGGVDILINNAGITRDATILKMTDDSWDKVIAVNLTAVYKLSQMAIYKMKDQNQGVILNAASVVAHYGNFGQTNYVATKAGVIGMTKTLAKEVGKYNIRVNAIAPGFIGTPMVRAMPEKVIAMMEEKTPLKRLGEPEEIADAYAFLASDHARFITGACINVDGGIILG